MTTKSQQPDKQDNIYELIDALQNDPKNEELQEKVILIYRDLVESIARKYSKNSTIHEDLTQVGMIGLIAAVRRYDKSMEKSFESFAVPTIVGEIKRFIRDKTWSIHVPRRIKELGPKIKKTIDALTSENQRSPTVKQIAASLDVSEEEVLETMEMGKSYKALSVDRKVEADTEGTTVSILDLIGDGDGGFDRVEERMLLEKILPVLSTREQAILRCTYFEHMSQQETGHYLGISQMHVSRLQRRSLSKLRETLRQERTDMSD